MSGEFWDKVAAKYAKRPVKDQSAYEKTLDRVRAHLKPDDQVLEIGCGTGTTALILAEEVAHYSASDISAAMIEIANKKKTDKGAENVNFLKAEIPDPRFKREGHDAVLAFNLLHLLEDPAAAISHARELIKPGGLFMSKTVCLDQKGFGLRLMITVMRLLGRAPYVNFMSIDTLEGLFRDAGFEILETGDYPKSPPSHFIVAKKI
ncbi:MAG: class I SAM-dependent methyltransferase [Pseudomonadota bacterium]